MSHYDAQFPQTSSLCDDFHIHLATHRLGWLKALLHGLAFEARVAQLFPHSLLLRFIPFLRSSNSGMVWVIFCVQP